MKCEGCAIAMERSIGFEWCGFSVGAARGLTVVSSKELDKQVVLQR